jgi:hypothetical protein
VLWTGPTKRPSPRCFLTLTLTLTAMFPVRRRRRFTAQPQAIGPDTVISSILIRSIGCRLVSIVPTGRRRCSNRSTTSACRPLSKPGTCRPERRKHRSCVTNFCRRQRNGNRSCEVGRYGIDSVEQLPRRNSRGLEYSCSWNLTQAVDPSGVT